MRITRTRAVIAALVLVFVALVAVSTWRAVTPAGDLDPASAAPAGTKAVVEILRNHGVQVEVVRHAAQVRANPGSTVLISQAAVAPQATLETLATSGADLVLLRPTLIDLDVLGLDGVTTAGSTGAGSAAPGCTATQAAVAQARSGGNLYRATGLGSQQVTVCFPDGAATSSRGTSPSGSWAVVHDDQRTVLIVGQVDILRNQYLLTHDDAALALRTLGGQPTLQWYIPDPLELRAGEAPTLRELIPPWVSLLGWALALSALATIYWRARRLGALVAEDLPVVVRASETVEGRARLYRRANARERVASTLRTATARRLAARLQATNLEPTDFVALLAQASAQPPEQVRHLFLGPPPSDDAALLKLAHDLDTIEQALKVPTTTRDGR